MIIFLDFDGVICTGRQAIAIGEKGLISGLDPVALMFLNRICREYKCQIVISSTWRICGKRDRRHFYELFACHGYVDLARAIHKEWATPNLPDGIRGEEIEKWLLSNDPDSDYIIIDDSPDMLEYQKSRFVQTDSYNGILMDHYLAIEKILKESQSDKLSFSFFLK